MVKMIQATFSYKRRKKKKNQLSARAADAVLHPAAHNQQLHLVLSS